jgi:hypothetical protein
MGDSTIRILGEPTYRLMQRYSLGVGKNNSLPVGANPGVTWDMGPLTTLPLQQTQAIRLVSGWCSLADFGATAVVAADVVPINFVFMLQSGFGGPSFVIRRWQPAILPPAVGVWGPTVSVQDDEFILGADYGEQGSISNQPLRILAAGDFFNNAIVARTVNATMQMIWEIYDREVPAPRNGSGSSGGGSGGNSGSPSMSACPAPGMVLKDGSCWIPTGLEALST